MRISDWSSDVCSSDLHPVVSALRHDLPARLAREDLLLRARLRLPADPDRHLDAYRSAVHRPARLADAARRQAPPALFDRARTAHGRSEEHTSELQSLMRISYAVFCLKKKKKHYNSQLHKIIR